MNEYRHIAELVSLGLSAPTIFMSMIVVCIWYPAVKFPLKTANDWFILGVVLGFTGSFLDNLFWAIPWTASYLNLGWKYQLFDIGVYFNIFMRQCLGIGAAYCHLRAYALEDKKKIKTLYGLFIGSHIMGLAYACYIVFLSMV